MTHAARTLLCLFALALPGCVTSTVSTCGCVVEDPYTGEWAQDSAGFRVTLEWLDGARFRNVFSKSSPDGDSILFNAIYRYTLSRDSSLIHYETDTILQSGFPAGAKGAVYHAYLRARGDSLLFGPTADWMGRLSAEAGHTPGSIFGNWKDSRPPFAPMVILPDSTGTLGGRPVRYRIDGDRIVHLAGGDPADDGAFYYRVDGDSLRLWQAKYDCSDTACRIDDEYNLIRKR